MNEFAKNALVIYHAHCMDGFGAAWVFHRERESRYEDVHYVAASYGDEFPSVYSKEIETDVYILDFSYSPDVLLPLVNKFNSIVMLDHHKSAIEKWSGYDIENYPENLKIIFDIEKSGAGLTLGYFVPDADAKNYPLVHYIQDRDLWKFNLPDSKEINAVIALTTKSFDAYAELNYRLLYARRAIAAKGDVLRWQHNKHVADIIATTARPFKINNYEGLICNCPPQFASDVGNELAKITGTFGATYYAASNGSHKFSLRSIGDFDVTKLAAEFGGGGHKNAAGFTISSPEDAFPGLTLWNLGKE